MGGLTEKPKGNRDTYKSSNICIMEMPKGERRKTGAGGGGTVIRERRTFYAAEDNEGFHP